MDHHEAQAAIAHPRLGYCGVIDERIDLSLLAALADAHPDWQVVAVGPVVKIDPATCRSGPTSTGWASAATRSCRS
jgi:UDP-galactopyranose mutase